MANLKKVSADDLRETLSKVDNEDAVKRLMTAITFKEIGEMSQKDAAELYGFSSSCASKWFQRLERLDEESFKGIVYGEPRDGKSPELTEQEHEQFIEALHNPPKKTGSTRPHGLCHSPTTPFVKNSTSNTASVTSVG
jgi:transposase